MSIDATDWSVDRTTGNIRYEGDDHGGASPTYATVIEFHRWLQNLADDASSAGDDELDITDDNPSARSTDNIITLLGLYNITDAEAEHLYDGSIIQNGGDDIYDGIVNFGNAGIVIQIIQDGAVLADDWWNENSGLNADAAQGISHRFMIKTRDTGTDVDGRRLIGTSREFGKTYAEFPINGTSRGNNVLALSNSNDLNNETIEGTVSGWSGISNNKEGFSEIDVDNNGSVEDYYSEWDKDTYSINQFYERMKWLTRDGSISTMYGLSGELFRGITHEINIDNPAGTFVEPEGVSWTGGTGQLLAIDSTTAGTKMWIQLLTGVPPTDGQEITGVSTATADVNVTVTERTIVAPFVGQSTGSALIGSYGLGLEATDLTSADKVFDLTDSQVTPPNYVTYTVGGLIHNEDRVLVGPWDGSSVDAEGNPAIDEDQLGTGLTVALSADNITTVTVGAANIPTDTPSTGYIRVADDNGFYRRLHYSDWENTGGTFTIDSTDGQEDFAGVNASIGNNVWIAYLDELAAGTEITAGAFTIGVTYVIATTGTTDFTLIGAADSSPGTVFTATGAGTGTGTAYQQSTTAAFTSVYNADRDLVVKVRDGGGSPIKEFITSATLGGNGGSTTAIRTSDA